MRIKVKYCRLCTESKGLMKVDIQKVSTSHFNIIIIQVPTMNGYSAIAKRQFREKLWTLATR